MPKNFVVSCDGTATEFTTDNTNVVKLHSTLVHDHPSQCAYWHRGTGTMEPPGAMTSLRPSARVSRRRTVAIDITHASIPTDRVPGGPIGKGRGAP